MRFPTLLATLAFAASPLHAGETVAVEHLGLRLTLPAEFAAAPQPVPDRGHVVFTGPSASGQRLTTVVVSRARGVNGWDALDADDDPPGTTTFVEQWQGSDTVCVRTVLIPDGDTVTLIAYVPQGRDAVNVSVFGPLDREAESRGLLRALLAGLELDPSPPTPKTRYEEFSEGVGTLSIAAVAVFAVAFALQYVRDRLRPHRRPRRGSSTYDGPRVYHE